MATKRKPVSITFQDKNTDLQLTAYAFDRAGNLISATPVKDSVDVEKLEADRVLVGPTIPKGGGREAPTLSSLRRMQAIELSGRAALDSIVIPSDVVKHWALCVCTVTGRVVRTIGGYDYPVCNVRVKICEVDKWPWLIYRLIDREIFAIRNDLLGLEPIEIKPRIPIPDPPPDLRRIVFKGDPAAPPHEGHGEEKPPNSVETAPSVAKALTAESRALFRTAAKNLPAEVKAGLASDSVSVVRQTLANSFQWISPLLYYWPWFWYHCDDLGTVTTDHDGRFTLFHWYPCGSDKPDIHFSVQAFIGGVWQTVYNPPKSTGTYWNYACGTEVTIRITDERVAYCDPTPTIPGKKVVVTTIGNNVNVATIQRAGAGVNEGLTAGGNPFGGSLHPHVSWGVEMRQPTNALPPKFFYRWSYRRLGSTGAFTKMDKPVFRRYMVEPSGADPEFRMLQLGPVPGMPEIMFMVPPLDPFDAAGPAQWDPLNLVTETASAFFESDEMGDPLTNAGKYELLLELFDNLGNLIPDWVAAGIEGFIPTASIPAPFPPATLTTVKVTGTAPLIPPDPQFYRVPDGMTSHGMRLVLHVDNNPCEASIEPLSGTGISTTESECGFYVYSGVNPQVRFRFHAEHPNNFATFSFVTKRGAADVVAEASLIGQRVGTTGNGFTRSGFDYDKSVAVTTLLGDCPRAAFVEDLHVSAMAVDGWDSYLGLDAHAGPIPFALSNV